MPFDHTLSAWMFLVPALLSCLGIAVVLTVPASLLALRRTGFARARMLHEVKRASLLSFAFAILGWTVGYFTGASRTGVVGDLLPAVLGFFGAVAGYVTLRYGQTIIASTMVVSVSLALFLGSSQGSQSRDTYDARHAMLPDLETMQLEAEKEWHIRKHRKELQLEWPPVYEPGWIKTKSVKQ